MTEINDEDIDALIEAHGGIEAVRDNPSGFYAALGAALEAAALVKDPSRDNVISLAEWRARKRRTQQ